MSSTSAITQLRLAARRGATDAELDALLLEVGCTPDALREVVLHAGIGGRRVAMEWAMRFGFRPPACDVRLLASLRGRKRLARWLDGGMV